MFVREIEKAKEMKKESSSIVMFTIMLESGKILPFYLVTDLCLFSILENIRTWRHSLLEYCVNENIKYSTLIGVSYVK